MKVTLFVTSLALVNSYVTCPPSQHRRSGSGLSYKSHEFESHEFEYGFADNRVRTLMSDDRVSVLNVLETDVTVKKRVSC
jgi:hypothetical protein